VSQKKIVVVQLAGGNDYLKSIGPYNDPLYVDNRPHVRIREERVLPLENGLGTNPAMRPIKQLYDQGNTNSP